MSISRSIVRGFLARSIVRSLNRFADSNCDTYVFSDTNTDYLAFDIAFTGNIKVILAAESETGINASILAGRQGAFTPTIDLLNDPQWIQYESDVTALSVIVGAAFNGVIGRFAIDDVWYDVDMGAVSAMSVVSGSGVPWLNQLTWG